MKQKENMMLKENVAGGQGKCCQRWTFRISCDLLHLAMSFFVARMLLFLMYLVRC